jgi:CIC family chloride channel protein
MLWRVIRHVTHGLPVVPQRAVQLSSNSYQSRDALLAFNRYGRAYFQRWLLIGALIGAVAGIGAIIFASVITLCTHLFLGGIAGFSPPAPAGEGASRLVPIARPWLLPLVTSLGGLLTGLIVFTLAPEAEGHGTDAAIEAFHKKGGRIRSQIPLVKLVASAITIGSGGSGGSAGREGPTAQISAGFGSWLGDLLHLDDHDRRIAVAAGIGSGIGAIFKAPFGGALLSAEILYKRDFEADALFPSFIASVIGFAIYGAWAGWTPIFGPGAHYEFDHVSSLLGYLVLGLCAGLVGLLYPKTLYSVRDLFQRIPVPKHLKPAIGGLLVGLIGLIVPQALGMGYGYAQFSINGGFVHIAAWLMAALVFVKILTTSLTIGSGGSGGVFGPGMVIGGFLGGAVWAALHAIAPGLVAGTNAGAFAVVGMGAFFGGIAKAPLAVILMVAEMTGEYALIAPAMLATMIAYLVTGDTSIYEGQVPTRLDSPAHKNDYALPLLQSLTVRDAMTAGAAGALATAAPDASVADLSELFRERHVASIPILDAGRLVGMVTPTDLARLAPTTAGLSDARQVMSRAVVRAFPDESLYQAWLCMSRRGLRQLPIVDRADPGRLLGMVTAGTIGQVLRAATNGAGAEALDAHEHAALHPTTSAG